MAQRCLAIWAAFALLPIAIVASVNFAVDPFQFFRITNAPRFSNMMQRYQQPGVIRNYPFGSILVGNSLVGNLRTDMFREAGLEPDVQNLSFWGSTLREAAYVVDFSLRTKPIRTVYWAIGRQWVLIQYRYGEFPACMYSGFWSHFPYCYLINVDIFQESLAIALDLKRLGRAEWVGSLEDWKEVPFVPRQEGALACEMQRFTRNEDVAALTRIAQENLAPLETPEVARFRDIVLPIVRANPRVRFKFMLPPLHLWQFWFNAAERGGVNLRTELAMIDAVIGEPNVEVHDLTAMTSLTHDSSRYDNQTMHYDFAGSREVVDALASGSMKITSLERHKEMLKNEIAAGGEMIRQSVGAKCP
jgi:hypothetical protein